MLIVAANYHQTRRHYATEMFDIRSGGQYGVSLCATDVYNQAYADRLAKDYGFSPKLMSTLPLCKRCERKAAKEGMEVPT